MNFFEPDFEEIINKIKQNSGKFEAFYDLLVTYNRKFNLTAIVGRDEVFHKHFVDSLAGERLFPAGAFAAEVGSGAGFPSLPLKIVRDDLKLTLIESTGKKCEFLRTAVKELGLKDVEVVQARAEDLGRDAHFRERYDISFARAVAKLNTLAEYCMPFVKPGGMFIAYKGSADETPEARRAIEVLGGGTVKNYGYALPEGYGERMLVVAEKCRRTPPGYPRGQGKERSRPIV